MFVERFFFFLYNVCSIFQKRRVCRSSGVTAEKRRTCGEEEDGHGAVVLPLRPPAEGNQGHQEGHQGRHGAGAQQHQGGNLPVCRARHTQVRAAELPDKSPIQGTSVAELKRCVDKHKTRANPTERSEWSRMDCAAERLHTRSRDRIILPAATVMTSIEENAPEMFYMLHA